MMETEQCEICGKVITRGNLMLHQLRCEPNEVAQNSKASSNQSRWKCDMCSFWNKPVDIICLRCASASQQGSLFHSSNTLPIPPSSQSHNAASQEQVVRGWNCPRCSFTNHEDILRCEMCDTPSITHSQSTSYQPPPIIDEGSMSTAEFTSASIVAGALGGAALALLLSGAGSSSDTSTQCTSRAGNRGNCDQYGSDREREDHHAHRGVSLSVFDGAVMGAGLGLLAGSLLSVGAPSDTHDSDQLQRQQSYPSIARRTLPSELPVHIFSSNRHQRSGSEGSECTVCMDPFVDGDEVKTLMCMHKFHSHCIDTWLARSMSCPICKYDV